MSLNLEYEEIGLKGPVKQFKELHYLAFEYDGLTYQGKPLDDYDPNNNRLILFDENHNLLETQGGFGDSSNKIIYDKDGDILEIISYRSGNLDVPNYRTVKKYSEDKRTVEDFNYNEKAELVSRNISKNDDKKRVTEYLSFNANNELESRTVWEYEGDFNSYTKYIQYNGEGKLVRISENKLNKQGHSYEAIEYDENEKVTSTKDYSYLYNEDGTPKRDEEEDELIHQHTVIVEEDKYGNWIKKIIYYKQKPQYIFRRDFIYYGETENNEEGKAKEDNIMQPLHLKNHKIVESDYWDVRHNVREIQEKNEPSNLELNEAQMQMVLDKSMSADKFSYFAYYAVTKKLFPCQIEYNNNNIEVFSLLQKLKYFYDVRIIHTNGSYSNSYYEPTLDSFTIIFYDHPYYLIHVDNISQNDEEDYEFSPNLTQYEEYEDGYLNLGDITILHPSDSTGKREKDFETMLNSLINDCMVEDKPEKPYIHVVEVSNGNFRLFRHTINNDFEIKNLDINYGYGFTDFHKELMQRFKSETKGLVLFHGQPGTGKTYYIRHLLREMANARKVVIYMPPNMVDYLTDPGFLTFLSTTVKTYSNNKQFCVLLIEDAEPLLAQRESENRIQGVTNLLNMTDGLLNDMLKLQMICTFNVELNKLDAALLRPGRLIARKEFKALTVLDANRLAQRLGITKEIKKPMNLSQIYALLKGKETIIHNPNEHE